jgi:hypothetical protein
MKVLLNLPKLFIIFLLLAFFYILETIVYIIYYLIESPLNFIGSQIEKIIRKLLSYVR